jgi:hypothetical protein
MNVVILEGGKKSEKAVLCNVVQNGFLPNVLSSYLVPVVLSKVRLFDISMTENLRTIKIPHTEFFFNFSMVHADGILSFSVEDHMIKISYKKAE